MTFNEPWALSGFADDDGVFVPSRCLARVNPLCLAENLAIEPYIVAHHILLSHAATVQVYREKYKKNEDEKIGITLFIFWFELLSNRTIDIKASKIALDFMFGFNDDVKRRGYFAWSYLDNFQWNVGYTSRWMDPLTYGQYPRRVQNLVGDRLLKFTDNEIKLLKKSYDFIGLQYYTSYYAKPNVYVDPNFVRYKTDSHVNITPYDYNGNLIGEKAYSPWFYIFPKGIRRLLKYTKDTYDNPAIYITENGVDNNNIQPVDEALKDQFRINYYRNHTWNVFKSIKEDKVNVTGYFAWSYIDNFEWNIGYTSDLVCIT
ncbi:hypothetical protein GH714_015185 [Hevea brasiliensis]|uniref:Beta-glucosidase n=1 Tax=Hevea brasiliensis TaxID=3981 RepID=A0A6A6N446_HEVBR|nr:hypothetical protein GH714_015185 [Hevea brasiliensis]